MTSTAQILITFLSGGAAGAALSTAVGWTTQRRQARAEALKTLALVASAWLEGPESFSRARAAAWAACLLAGIDRVRVEAFMATASQLAYAAVRAQAGAAPTGPDLAKAKELEFEMYEHLEAMRVAPWHPWRNAISQRIYGQDLRLAPPRQSPDEVRERAAAD